MIKKMMPFYKIYFSNVVIIVMLCYVIKLRLPCSTRTAVGVGVG